MAKRKVDGTISTEKVINVTSGQATYEEEYSFKWKIENFLMIKSSTLLIDQLSFDFTTGESYGYPLKWCYDLEHQSDTKSIVPFLNLVQRTRDLHFRVFVNHSLRTIKPNGQFGRTDLADGLLFTVWNRSWGCPNLIPRDDKAQRELIWEDGSILIQVKVKVFLFDVPITVTDEWGLKWEVDFFEMMELYKLRKSLTKMIEPDDPLGGKIIKLVAKDQKEFFVKCDILSARSPVFNAMLKNGKWKESGCGMDGEIGSIVLKDLSGKTVNVLLHYLYGGRLLKEDWKADDVILELTWAAQKYQLDRLTQFLDKVLPIIDVGSVEILARLALLTKRLKMKNSENKLFVKLKETAIDIDELVLDKGDSILGLE